MLSWRLLLSILIGNGAKFFEVAANSRFWEAKDGFWEATGADLNGQRSLEGAHKGILGMGSIAFLVRRTLFGATSRFRTDSHQFWDVNVEPQNSKSMHFAPYIL